MNYEEIFEICRRKLEWHIKMIPKENPEFCACSDGKYFSNENPLGFMDIQTWMPSFFTGEVLLAYERSKEQRYLDWLEQFEDIYEKKVLYTPSRRCMILGSFICLMRLAYGR